MGTDIHLYVEYRHREDAGDDFTSFCGRINPGRNYALFAALANVRQVRKTALFEPRGLPDKMGCEASLDSKSGERYAHSWLTLAEFCKVLVEVPTAPCEYHAVEALMEQLEQDGYETRIVFWFDC
jgi:hypothetical protein